MLYVDDGRIESTVRAVALDRKNYLFAGSDAGGERAATMGPTIESEFLTGLSIRQWPDAYRVTQLEAAELRLDL